MNEYFQLHNSHLKGALVYKKTDPQLLKLQELKYIHSPKEIDKFLKLPTGIYTLSGGRQIGKSTLLKQWVLRLVESQVPPQSIRYITGELISDHKELVRLLGEHVDKNSNQERLYIICDEVTDIAHWDKGIKFLADAGKLTKVILMLSGSDSSIIKEARNRLPGRRGEAVEVDFHFSPLSFKETVELKYGDNFLEAPLKKLFHEYLIHGGFLTAINKYAQHSEIPPSTFTTYTQWILGDMAKRGKSEAYLMEVLRAITIKMGSQVTWNSLAKELSIDHHKTVSDYLHLLEDLDVVFIQSALIEDKLVGAPKKAKKVYFTDPFIYHSVCSMFHEEAHYFPILRKEMENSSALGSIVELVAIQHISRAHPRKAFYIKSEGEVDIAYVNGSSFYPIEIKWGQQIRAKDIKQIRKYKNGEVWGQYEDQSAHPPVHDLIKKLLSLA